MLRGSVYLSLSGSVARRFSGSTKAKRLSSRADGTPIAVFWNAAAAPSDCNKANEARLTMPGKIDDPVWVDVLTGNAYRLAASNVTEVGGNSVYRVPVYDSPAFVTDRRVLDLELSEYAKLLAELREFASAAVFGVMRGFFEANAFASLFDVVRPECRASSVGFLNVAAGLIGSLAPIFLGMLSDRFGVRGYEIGFACLGGVLALAAVALAASFFFTFRRDRLGG